MPKDKRKTGERLEFAGWVLFVVSALFFIVASLHTEDIVGLIGGILFLLVCLVFLAAFRERDGKR